MIVSTVVSQQIETYSNFISFLSSKTCSNCGHVQDMPFNLRTYDCLDCCFSIDRDLQQLLCCSTTVDMLYTTFLQGLGYGDITYHFQELCRSQYKFKKCGQLDCQCLWMSKRRRPQFKQEVKIKMSHYEVLYWFYEAAEQELLKLNLILRTLLVQHSKMPKQNWLTYP